MTRLDRIRSALERALHPQALEVIDQSQQHAGHAGAASGRGHFAVRIVSETFAGLPPIQRHRLIYQALGELMQTEIHALAITAQAPSEQN